MYSFGVPTGLADAGDARSMALLQQHQRLISASRLSAQQGRTTGVGSMIQQACHGLSASELMSASSLQDRERMITAELLKHRLPHLGHQDQVATAMALASRNQVLSKQQQQQHSRPEDLILKRAISQLSSIPRHPMHHGSHPQSSGQSMGNQHNRCGNSPVYCAEQDLSLEKDICFGRGQRVQRRKANVAFRKIVATYQETYDQAVSREDKKVVVKKVARIFSRTGYRFFKESKEPARFGGGFKLWSAVSDHHVEYKIGHSFRSGRKQLKQQKTQRKEKEGSDASVCSTNEVQQNKNQSDLAKEPSNRCIYKEEELSEKCICIGDKREKYTGMEAYQYFREFILTFKSILGMTESIVEKTKIVSCLIDQIKSQKRYKFLKLMPLKKDAEFWVEASTEEISSEVFSIIGNPLKPNQKKTVPAHDELPSVQEKEKNLKRSPDTTGDSTHEAPKKKRCISLDSALPAAVTQIVSDVVSASNVDVAGMEVPKKRHLVPSSSSTTNEKEKVDPKFIWKKGRKPTLPEGVNKQSFVPSEIICKPNIDQAEGLSSESAKSNNRTDSLSKVQGETMPSAASQGVRIPSSLFTPEVLLGKVPFGNPSSGALERSLEMLRGSESLANKRSGENTLMRNRLSSQEWPGRSTLEKALLTMRPSSIQRTSEQPIAEAANQIKLKGNMLQHLRQQEMLYLEKKHKLAMLELQLRSQNGGV